jgi:tRNA(Ile)-lysidine synthase
MIKLQGKLPRDIYLACSGGIDSMAALDFLRRNHKVTVLYYNHNTAHGHSAYQFLLEYCRVHDIDWYPCVGELPIPVSNKEEVWRTRRYNFFDKFTDMPVITCHHLDDCVETWLFSSLNGTGKIIPRTRGHILRPFRLNRKRDLEMWAALHGVPHIEDDSNKDTCYSRNYIRHTMMPHVLKINPGIHKTIATKVRADG